jgi:hypothetical protein
MPTVLSKLPGRDIGCDFSRMDGWSMYHGDMLSGFPARPPPGLAKPTVVRG